MTEEETRTLFETARGKEIGEESSHDAGQLRAELNHLPLAVTQAEQLCEGRRYPLGSICRGCGAA